MPTKTLALFAFSLLVTYAPNAFAQIECDSGFESQEVATEVAKLGKVDGKTVKLMTISCPAASDYVEVDAWILIGDASVKAFPGAESMAESGYTFTKLKKTKGGATFTVLSDVSPHYHYYGPRIIESETWSFDFTTRTSTLVEESVDDPREKEVARLVSLARKGEIERVFGAVYADLLCCWDLDDTGGTMNQLLQAVDFAAKKAHRSGRKRRAAKMVVSALSPIWKTGLRVGSSFFEYGHDGETASEYWSVLASKESTPPWLYANFGFYLTEGGEHEKAVQLLTAVVHVFPKHTPAWLNLADAHAALGHEQAATNAYAKYAERRTAQNKKIPSRVSKALHVSH